MSKFITWGACAILAVAFAPALAGEIKETTDTKAPLQGPRFTQAQATEGEKLYKRECMGCHGADLMGTPFSPPITGDSFYANGAAISLHSDFHQLRNLHPALDILETEGADLSRVIMGHITTLAASAASDIALLESLLRRGVSLQFDLLGYPPTGYLWVKETQLEP